MSRHVSGARGVDHLGITVADVESASTFLVEALGAEVLYDLVTTDVDGTTSVHPSDAPAAVYDRTRAVGLHPSARVRRFRLMRLGDGPSIELFEFEGVDQRSAAVNTDFGLQHFAVYVDDIYSAAKAVQRAGGELLEGPQRAPGWESGDTSYFHYVRTPWGTLMELITYPDGQRHMEQGRSRWRPGSRAE